ncbi:MAG: hypothetical protein DCC88_05560 [Spirobacillus cienkowskii]|jgi:two-component system chemotaxis sensor kinase CheA|uniref:histidine kinase n=1 Tax=Spirobacillus cienkowskii TaxID=495820 RepID=A0A369KSI1_9BACT|nr:MAG: hypothetical protein DCC88_05560 [Spirobacillus cienkowskii]
MEDFTNNIDFTKIFLEEAKETLEKWEKTCLEIEKNPNQEEFTTLFRYAHNLKGSAKSVNLNNFASFIHKVEDFITLLRDGKKQFKNEYVSLFLKCHAFMEYWCTKLESDTNFIPSDLNDINFVIEQVISKSSDAISQSYEIISTSTGSKNTTSNNNENSNSNPSKKNIKADSIRIPANKIDIIIEYISELCTHHAVISHCSSTDSYNSKSFKNSVQISDKIIKNLQTNVFSLRMINLQTLFQRLERTAKDLARQQGKDLEINIEGSEVELDKNIIENIVDPFVHVIRNAVDHGLEKSEERANKNKPIKSKILLSAKQNINDVVISIQDDGKGIDRDKIYAKAAEKKIINGDEELSEQEVYQLLFKPGFSTAESITEVSGRGVGLDVVNQALNDIGGFVHITSEINKGTCFEFHLPSNLSIIEVLTIKVDGLNYVIPITEIKEVLDLTKIKVDHVTNSENIALLREFPIIIKTLSKYLPNNLKSGQDNNTNKIALVTNHQDSHYAFEIDELYGIESIVVRKKSEKFNDIKYYIGSAVLPNGEPAFILSLIELIKQIILPKTQILNIELRRNEIEHK